MLINKKPNGAKSPNLADCVIMLYAPDLKPSRGFFDLDDEDEQTDEYAPTFENFF